MMKTSLSLVLALAAAVVSAAEPPAETPGKDAAGPLKLPVAPGPFHPTEDSLAQYKCPEWFRDAKLGIWAHWGPQSVPMDGDWYARNLYIQGQAQYKDHLEHYGHPTKQGYKDIIPLWKAEKWDPERLMALYKKAGARYFVSMGVHHDNFDLWNSNHHKWNAVAMGPRRDVVGDWQKAARKEGLRFGVSEHLGASFTWFQPSHGSDKTGPLAGVPYDGADPKFQDLYHPPAAAGDTGWYSKDPRWQQEWYDRIKDLVDQYHPDLLYSDGPVPFGNEVGRSMIAHLYNSDAGRHGGAVEAVYTCKQPSQGRWVEDLERGVMPGIRPEPWQTDTSIGDWFYNRNWKYRGADWVVHTLVDVVSKNGNLLINVVQRPDGSLDAEAEQTVERLADWVAVNGEGIYGTRPWLVHGEGPVRARGGSFKEDFAYSAQDVRFTSRGDRTLYAFILGWPAERRVVIRSLAEFPGVTGKITGVTLLGHEGRLEWTRDGDGLTVRLPAEKPCDYAVALKITGEDLRGFKPELAAPEVPAVAPDSSGNYTLGPDEADLHGALQVETRDGKANIGHWDSARDSASWKLQFKEAGKFRVMAQCATIHPESAVVFEVAGQKGEARVPMTGSWDRYTDVSLGTVEVKQAGEQTLTLRPRDEDSWKAINVRWVKLVRAAE
jgi:alpha-L-fucosidase